MTTTATRDKWIKAAEGTVEHEKARKTKAEATVTECQRRIDEAEKRIDWLKAMPVEDAAEENPATDVEDSDVDEILDVRAAADAMPDEDEPFEYPKPEGTVPVREGGDGEPSDWAQDTSGPVKTRA